jgi:hypothetical protein
LGPLIDTGPFALIRNPLYVGNILLWVGFALVARLVWLAPVVVLLLGAEYHAIVRWEESLLVTRLGDAYRAYTSRVPRWLPTFNRARPSTLRGPQGRPEHSRRATSSGRAMTTPFMVSQSNHEPKPSAELFSWKDTLFSERGTFVAMASGYLLLWIKAHF